MPKRKFRATLIDMFTKEGTPTYTWAYSYLQAYHNFAKRHSYPPYIITQVTDLATGKVMDEEPVTY